MKNFENLQRRITGYKVQGHILLILSLFSRYLNLYFIQPFCLQEKKIFNDEVERLSFSTISTVGHPDGYFLVSLTHQANVGMAR